MARARTVWRCQSCGASAPKWYGRCPDCGEFGTFVEEAAVVNGPRGAGALPSPAARIPLSEVGH
ncbi:MAG: DNA repair protein RadA, partial [Coriobacteriia bacterium]|nr:DNA repair protein RadA [Coriobacteriia bacterium]